MTQHVSVIVIVHTQHCIVGFFLHSCNPCVDSSWGSGLIFRIILKSLFPIYNVNGSIIHLTTYLSS